MNLIIDQRINILALPTNEPVRPLLWAKYSGKNAVSIYVPNQLNQRRKKL
jgi:hypothetical protein